MQGTTAQSLIFQGGIKMRRAISQTLLCVKARGGVASLLAVTGLIACTAVRLFDTRIVKLLKPIIPADITIKPSSLSLHSRFP
jgi:hypothetical protein